jgi:hypothetical protein
LGFGVPPPPPLDFPVGEVQVPVLVSIRRPPRRSPSGERRRAPGASLGSSIREDPTVRKNMGTAPQPEKRRASASPRRAQPPRSVQRPASASTRSGRHPTARAAGDGLLPRVKRVRRRRTSGTRGYRLSSTTQAREAGDALRRHPARNHPAPREANDTAPPLSAISLCSLCSLWLQKAAFLLRPMADS